ncbi:hypothetical protein NUU61_002783 [Penicillium alfredii]|uniref:Uncharacterized protein n=1 Tax=Penicillium alfredii TaxID=1506179 RepID=A0A9W9KGX3_9EURO|nr:uncharacterized protein NUU61_002783 [Penicillium alfredii]KAJ5105436.1 hypothetical protein NUU61_002783 [Penicillium alfredii]
MEANTSSSSRSRRSYPSLHPVSLAPLTPRFPIDDDPEPVDYFSPRGDGEVSGNGTRTPPRMSYFSSVSVPSTPPILSHSRSASRTRHSRSKSSSRAGPLSDTNLHSRDLSHPLHHHHHQQASHKKQSSATHIRRRFAEPGNTHASSKSDTEWMLRAGIALASSTREEKGQSWLSKRESSTSLVSFNETPPASHPNRHHHRTKSGASSRKSHSGASTPGAVSRRSSRPRGTSRRGSRAGLTMTTIPPASAISASEEEAGKDPSPGAGTTSPEVRGRSTAFVPDFVDEQIRAEMASLQQRERGFSDDQSEYWDRDGDGEEDGGSDSEYDSFSDDSRDDFDEADLQRLTRERGFGLGSWIDRLVEWTLFGVEELPAPATSTAAASAITAAGGPAQIGTAATTTTVTFEEPVLRPEWDSQPHETLSLVSAEDDHPDDHSHTDAESAGSVEKPGVQGGWEDAGWLFRVMKRTLI